MRKLSAVFFDFDGTLVDSLPLMVTAYQDFFRRYQLDTNQCAFDELNGPPLSKVIEIIRARYSLSVSYDELFSQFLEIIEKLYLQAKPVVPNANLLQTLHKNQIPVFLVTSSFRKFVEAWLVDQQLLHYFSGIVTAEDVVKGKPNPEPYLLALELAQCDAAETIAIEDSVHGASSSIAANIKTYCLKANNQIKQHNKITWLDSFDHLIDLINLKMEKV